jgi:hypothetical protein
MNKQYNSFEEIDCHLKILDLKRKINAQSLKLEVKQVKTNLKYSNLLEEFQFLMQQKTSVWLLKSLLKLVRRD